MIAINSLSQETFVSSPCIALLRIATCENAMNNSNLFSTLQKVLHFLHAGEGLNTCSYRFSSRSSWMYSCFQLFANITGQWAAQSHSSKGFPTLTPAASAHVVSHVICDAIPPPFWSISVLMIMLVVLIPATMLFWVVLEIAKRVKCSFFSSFRSNKPPVWIIN